MRPATGAAARTSLIEMAELDRRRGRLHDGLGRATEAGQLAAQMELPDLQWRALTLIGRLQLERSRRVEARDAFDAAIAVIEGMRSRNPGPDEARSRFFADRLAPYRERIALALASSDTAEALSFAERSKARALLDVIRGGALAVTTAMTDDERTQEVALRTSLSSVNSELALAARAASPDESRVSGLRRNGSRSAWTSRSFKRGCTRRIPSFAPPAPRRRSSTLPMRSGCCPRRRRRSSNSWSDPIGRSRSSSPVRASACSR